MNEQKVAMAMAQYQQFLASKLGDPIDLVIVQGFAIFATQLWGAINEVPEEAGEAGEVAAEED